MPRASQVVQSEGRFIAVGAHNSGLAIASAVTLTIPDGATKLRIQTLTQNVRYRLDGTNPTASAGFQLKAGDAPLVIAIHGAMTIRVIEEAATASMQYQFGK
jgi:hypothetical protein